MENKKAEMAISNFLKLLLILGLIGVSVSVLIMIFKKFT